MLCNALNCCPGWMASEQLWPGDCDSNLVGQKMLSAAELHQVSRPSVR